MSIELIIGLILSWAIGFSLGLIGGGGSILTIPVLVYVMGVETQEAISMSLAIVGVTSLIGAILHYKHVKLSSGALFGITGMVGAYLGSDLTYLVSPPTLLFIFAFLMLVIALAMLLKSNGENDIEPKKNSIVKSIIAGLLVGLLTGFLGVGGGFLIVPALVFFGGLAMKDAIGTSLLVITINCIAGLVGHLQHGFFNISLATLVTIIAVLGVLIGTKLSHQISTTMLKKGFATFVILIAIFLIIKNNPF